VVVVVEGGKGVNVRVFRGTGRREKKVEAKGKKEGSTGRRDSDSEADFAIGHSAWSPRAFRWVGGS
jgi:hypothetical protein